MGRTKTEIVLIKNQKGFGIFDTEEDSFIGFQKYYKGTTTKLGGAKSLWKTSGQAKSAFKFHTDVYFDSQTRYVIKEIL